MNPSNANVDTATANVKDHFAFMLNSGVDYTRAASKDDIEIDSARYDKSQRGLLNVYFSMKNADQISKIAATGDSKVDVMALSYKYQGEQGDTKA